MASLALKQRVRRVGTLAQFRGCHLFTQLASGTRFPWPETSGLSNFIRDPRSLPGRNRPRTWTSVTVLNAIYFASFFSPQVRVPSSLLISVLSICDVPIFCSVSLFARITYCLTSRTLVYPPPYNRVLLFFLPPTSVFHRFRWCSDRCRI